MMRGDGWNFREFQAPLKSSIKILPIGSAGKLLVVNTESLELCIPSGGLL
jgi:hypothetical protein